MRDCGDVFWHWLVLCADWTDSWLIYVRNHFASASTQKPDRDSVGCSWGVVPYAVLILFVSKPLHSILVFGSGPSFGTFQGRWYVWDRFLAYLLLRGFCACHCKSHQCCPTVLPMVCILSRVTVRVFVCWVWKVQVAALMHVPRGDTLQHIFHGACTCFFFVGQWTCLFAVEHLCSLYKATSFMLSPFST